jgi:N-acetylglutamate synthase-like GNAT family acetyltransferase
MVTIRRAKQSDCRSLTALMHRSQAYHGAYAAILAGYAVSEDQVVSDEVYLAEDGGRLLGFYSLVVRDQPAELDLLFVDDDAQGTGVGALLFRHMQARARVLGCPLVVIVSNPSAEEFYRRMGAERVGTKPPAGKVTWQRPILVMQLDSPHDTASAGGADDRS